MTHVFPDDHTIGSRGRLGTYRRLLRMPKADTKSAIRWHNDNQMQANASKFQFMHTGVGTQAEIFNVNILV